MVFSNFSRGGLTIPTANLVNYVCTTFVILEFVDDLITKSGLPVRKATERVLIHCSQSLETFAWSTHEAIARKITNCIAVNICFSNKRKFVRTQWLPMEWTHLRKDKGKSVLIKIYCFCFYFRLMLCFVIFSKTKFLPRSLIYVHNFGVSQGTNG